MANMYYDPERGGFVRKIPGTGREILMGGEEDLAMQQRNLGDRQAFYEQHRFNRSMDYSDDFQGLFGAEQGGDLYYGGPNKNWRHALSDRLGQREGGSYGYGGYYEGSTRSMGRDQQAQMYRRNNAIEDMYRRGYSQAQLNSHLSGERNVLEEGPDWADYKKFEEEATASSGNPFEGNYVPATGQWYRQYFKGGPGGTIQNPLAPDQDGATPDVGQPTETKGGFLEAYNKRKSEIAEENRSVRSMFKDMINE